MTPQFKQKITTYLAFALIPLSGFATDIYLPSLPGMETSLHVASIQIQMTMTLFLISYGISQLFIGSVVDSFGRYRPALIGLFLFAIASIIIANTQNIYVIYGMRIVQGFTVAMIVVAKRAYFVDVYEGKELQRYLSLFTIIWSVGPIVAPFLGGYFDMHFGWEFNFYFLGVYALLLAFAELAFGKETIRIRSPFNLRNITHIYWKMFSTPSFTFGLFLLAFAYSMVMVYNMTGPFIIEHEWHLTPVITGYCSLLLGFAWMLGGFIGKATIAIPFFKKMIWNVALQVLFVVTMIASLSIVNNLYSLVFFAFIIHVCSGYTFNNYFTYSLTRFPQNAGIAGGLTGGVVYIILSFLTYGIVAVIPAKDEANLSYSYAILIALSILFLAFAYSVREKNTISKQ